VLGLIWDIGKVLIDSFYLAPIHLPPLVVDSVLQLVSEPVRSLVVLNRL
jgi:hypothetical protein